MADDGDGSGDGDDAWAVAKHRADVIRALLKKGGARLDPAEVRAAGITLGIGRTTLYRFIGRFRAGEVTSALLPARRGRPNGVHSLDAEREGIIANEIERFYLKAERPRLSDLVEQIAAQCYQAGLPVPNWRTVSRRVKKVDPVYRARKRHDVSALQDLTAVPGGSSPLVRWTSFRSTIRP